MSESFITASAISKRYGGVIALDNMNLTLEQGEIHAIVGENGAGKSTLMKILAGVERRDSGRIAIGGIELDLASPMAARAVGIGIVFQELSIFPHASVLENLFVEREPTKYGFISFSTMRSLATPVLEMIGLNVPYDIEINRLSIGERQLVEICRALLENPRVLILDEPNSALSAAESARLFDVLRRLKDNGITILYVSHRLREVLQIADRVTVMRNGCKMFTRQVSNLSLHEMTEAMIGRSTSEEFPDRIPDTDENFESRLSVKTLTVPGQVENVTFEACGHEILGLAGLEGSGNTSILYALFGARSTQDADVTFPDGGELPSNPGEAANRGCCLVPADRRRDGLMLLKSVATNINQASVSSLGWGLSWLSPTSIIETARRHIDALRITTPTPMVPVNELSGGNQQKVLVAKWLELSPRIILLDDPTRGIDVGAKYEIYVLIRKLASSGRIVLITSSELPELLGLADRILVFYKGHLIGEKPASYFNRDSLLRAINTGSLN